MLRFETIDEETLEEFTFTDEFDITDDSHELMDLLISTPSKNNSSSRVLVAAEKTPTYVFEKNGDFHEATLSQKIKSF